MTGPSITSAQVVLTSDVFPEAVATFATLGWSTAEWDDLYRYFTSGAGGSEPGGTTVANWLLIPKRWPLAFRTPPAPASIRALFARHGKRTEHVLDALAVGASERFIDAFQGPVSNPISRAAEAQAGWRHAVAIGLAEPQATGWAATGYLHSRRHRPSTIGSPTQSRADLAALISQWTAGFGQDAWSYVLAGITLTEAFRLKETGQTPTAQQLRVMVALNGHTLPPGI